MNTSEYQFFGASALICFSFACWQLLYVVLHFLDKAQPIKNITLTYRLFFLVWLIGCSYLNSDHPVRVYANNSIQQQIAIPSHFEKWVDTLFKSSNIANAHAKVPIFLIAAEGGGLRTGAFTALLLSKLQDSFPDFKKHIYAYSTVSGGGLGTHFFNSINNDSPALPAKGYAELSRIFFKTDFLSAVIGKLVFGEVIQWISPIYIPLFDRAITLEKVWEEAWQSATGSGEMKNVFSTSIAGNNQRIQPAYFINTVEAETGMPCIWTNMKLGNSFPFSEDRNLQKRFPFQLRYSTAINLSTRFPLISPSAMFAFKVSGKQIRRHYVDGGYYDNSGQETMLQVLKSIPFEKHPSVKPYIICFNFSESDTTTGRGIRFANDVSEIVRAIYQTHNARTAMASAALKDYCNNRFSSDQYIALSLDINTNQLPMNWVLSNSALQRVDHYTNDLMHQKKNSSEMCKILKAISSP